MRLRGAAERLRSSWFASTDALPERGNNPFLIGTCKPQGSRGRTLPSAPRSWPLDASHSCPGACDFQATSMIGITGCAPTVERTSQNRGWARMGSSVRKEKARPAQARRAECVQRCQRCMTPPARPRLSEPLIRSNRGHMPMVAVTLAPGQRPWLTIGPAQARARNGAHGVSGR